MDRRSVGMFCMPGLETSAALVIDASVLINLLGCGATVEVLRLLPVAVLIEQRTLAEVLTGSLACSVRSLPSNAHRFVAARFAAFSNADGATVYWARRSPSSWVGPCAEHQGSLECGV